MRFFTYCGLAFRPHFPWFTPYRRTKLSIGSVDRTDKGGKNRGGDYRR